MPRIPDKIIINCASAMGLSQAIYSEMDNIKFLGREIEDSGWGAETMSLRDQIASACVEHRIADVKYLEILHSIGLELDEFINRKLAEAKK